MKNFYLVCTSDFYYMNKIFNLDSPANRDNYYYPTYLLRTEFYKQNMSLNTYDYLDKSTDDNYGLIFFDIPENLNKYFLKENVSKKYLVIWESEIIHPKNWMAYVHKHFDKIFTWNDKFVDNKKYYKINFANKIPDNINFDLSKKNRLCTVIAGNNSASHPLELYSERRKAIRWFEKNHPEDFDLYGIGWDKYRFRGILSHLNRFEFLTKILRPDFPSYKGTVRSKTEVMQKYKFAICYENARDIPGYITEKIFDCFFAGCVPVYWGAPNVTDHIPEDTFIDKRKFGSYEEIYDYLMNMSEKEYMGYLTAIKRFIESDKIYPFSAEHFAQKIVTEISKDL